jgi:glycosyltransferase involved in cell wall biosynthesis
MNILVLSPYPPYPPYGGGTMRIYQIVRGLAARNNVTCLTFAPDAAAEQALEPLRQMCRVMTVRGPEPRGIVNRAITTAASPLPDMALRNRSSAYAAALGELVAHEQFDVVQAESIEMAPYLEMLRANQAASRPTLVLDQFNAEFVLQRRAAQTSLQALRQGAITPRNGAGAIYSLIQWIKLANYERQAMQACDAVLAVSEDDRRTLLQLDSTRQIAVIPNGVQADHFSRDVLRDEQAGPLVFQGLPLVFSGTLDFRPNIDAVLWFAREVLPLIRARKPDVRLLVVGKRPVPVMRQLPGDAVSIIGEVPDTRPYIAGSAVYVVPMRIGGGVRLKLLEALAMEAPTVSTAMGAEGVAGLREGEHCLIANTPADFAAAVLHLIDHPEYAARLGAAGRTLVQHHYDWSVIIPRLETLYRSFFSA